MNGNTTEEKQATGAKGNGTRWLSFVGSLMVTVLVFLWIGRDIEPMDVVDAITDMAPPEILLFIISSIFMSICRAWRLLLLLEPVGYRPGRLAMLLTVLVRNLFADLLPARLGGLIYLWLCRTRLGVSWGAASSSMAISFVFDMIAVSPLLIVVGLVIAGELGIARILIWAFGLAVAGGALVVLFLLAPLADLAAGVIPRLPLLPARVRSGLAAFAVSIAEDVRITRRAGIFLPILVLSVLVRLAKYTAMYFLLLGILMPMGFGLADLPPHKGLVGLIAPEIAASLPVSGIGGFGAYEGTWAVAFHFLGLPEQMAKLTGVAHHLFTQAYGAGIGLVALLLLFLPLFKAGDPRPAVAVSATRRWLQMAASVAVWLGISTAVLMASDVLVDEGNAAQKETPPLPRKRPRAGGTCRTCPPVACSSTPTGPATSVSISRTLTAAECGRWSIPLLRRCTPISTRPVAGWSMPWPAAPISRPRPRSGFAVSTVPRIGSCWTTPPSPPSPVMVKR